MSEHSAENDATMRERIHLVLDAVSDCEHTRSVGMSGACDYCLSVALVAAGCVIPPGVCGQGHNDRHECCTCCGWGTADGIACCGTRPMPPGEGDADAAE